VDNVLLSLFDNTQFHVKRELFIEFLRDWGLEFHVIKATPGFSLGTGHRPIYLVQLLCWPVVMYSIWIYIFYVFFELCTKNL
jgi:hypothetical protein